MTTTRWQSVRNALRPVSFVLALASALCAGASLIAVAPAQGGRREAQEDAVYTIKRVYKAGDADRYKITVKMNMDVPMSPIDMVETMIMKETTREAKEDGSSIVVFDFESLLVTANGRDIDMTSMMPKITTTTDKAGKTDVKVEGGNEQVTAQMGDQVKQFTNGAKAFIPKKPVKVGDSWDVEAANFGAAGQNVKGKSTLVSVEVVKGEKVGKIKSVMEITGEMNTKLHSETTSLINLVTGKALSSTSKTEGQAAGNKFTMEMSMRMLAPGEKGNAGDASKDSSKL